MGETPQHKYELVLRTGGNDWDELRRNLENWLTDLALREPGEVTTYGGTGYMFVFETPDQTSEEYFKQVNEWIEKRRAERKTDNQEDSE